MSRSNKTILVVEDSPLNRELLAEMLALGGYTVLLAASGGEGMAMARNRHPDLILMDISFWLRAHPERFYPPSQRPTSI